MLLHGQDNPSDEFGLGLKDVLGQLDREQARVKIRVEARRFGKPSTIIEGLNMSRSALLDLSGKMKKRLATGGTVEDQSILLQGDHRNEAAKLLVEVGFPENTIQVV